MSSQAYTIALNCLKKKCDIKNAYANNLYKAMDFFSSAVRRHNDESTAKEKLEEAFDIDNVINFSDAWCYWNDLYSIFHEGQKPTVALDRRLFAGEHPNSEKYFQGIESLATRNAQAITGILSQFVSRSKERKMIDLGAGPGIYSKAFVAKGLASESTCLDLPYVVKRYHDNKDRALSWKEGDLLNKFQFNEKYGLVFMANVLHHYDPQGIRRILKNIDSILDEKGLLVIQDYILWPKPALSPIYASILGVHFALTTEGSRCYTCAEIVSMVEKNISSARFSALINAGQTDLLIFKGGEN